MSAPPAKPSSAPTAENEVELQSQPMDLASKPILSSNLTIGGNTTASARQLITESKPIILVKPTGSPVPSLTAAHLSTSLPVHSSTTVIQNSPASVAVSVPITVNRFQTAIRQGTTVTLAPKPVPTVVASTASYSGVGAGSHVPKGPAAVASIGIPRSAVASSAVIRPVPTASSTVSQAGFSIATRPARPSSLSVKPAGVEAGAGASSPLSGTWVTVTPAAQPPVTTLYKSSTGITVNPTAKSTSSLVLTGNAVKSTPVLTPALAGSSISIVGQPKTPASSASANITLSVRGASNQGTSRPSSTPTAAVTIGPRPEVIKTTPTVPQAGPQRAAAMTITSTSTVQGVEKHVVKTISGVTVGSASPSSNNQGNVLNRANTLATAPVQISTRTVPPTVAPHLAASSVITANSAVSPVVFTGNVKTIPAMANITTVGKNCQQGAVAVQLPQMSVSTVATKLGASAHASSVPGIRPIPATGTLSIGTIPGTGVGGTRTYLVTTQAPNSNIIPVAKVLPQPTGTSITGSVASLKGEAHGSSGQYLHPSSRHGAASINESQAPVSSQPNTPSKLIGTSPRPSILRKRDVEGVPLKAQKNLTTTLALITTSATSTSSTNSATAFVSTTPAISPPSPRRIELNLTPGGPNGDSSRSSSGGSTTLSASSSPGIPPDMDESNTSTNVPPAPASALDKALSNIQVKQEVFENADAGSAIASLMKMKSSSSSSTTQAAPVEFQMSPRKKPRKQQLLGQELQEVRSSDDELNSTMNLKEVKHESSLKAEPKEVAAVVKRPRVSLINSYRQTWKARNHHFTRYTDVKLKDERRPTVTDLANQKHVLQKVHGWKIFHLSAQVEEMAHSESQIHERLSAVLDAMEKLGNGRSADRDLMRVNELIKGNLQRSKVIQDGLEDSKVQVQKIFDHKPRAEEIIQRYMYKRLAKKREKL